jgi:riboflavin kinase / FMN adenylyltransferase
VQRWRGVEQVPRAWGRCVVTIGVFDGVHRGHQRIIGRAVELGQQLGVPSVVITFDPHPIEVIRPGSHPPMLTDPRFKADLVEELGVDAFLVLPFTVDFMRLTAAEFVHAVLVERLHASAVVVGENFRYGNGGAGTVQSLTDDGHRFGFSVEPFPLQGEGGRTWSSTYVRSCVAAGDMREATEALGREHRVHGIIVRGDQRGRQIGFPTANLEPLPWSAIPADGIYAGRLARGKDLLPAAISIGTNPTFQGDERRVEAYVLDFDGDLYGEHVGMAFTERLRDTVRFPSVDDLVAQMELDVARTREIVSHPSE